MTYDTITTALRSEQRRQGLTDAELARRSGVGQSTITRCLGDGVSTVTGRPQVLSTPAMLAVVYAGLGKDLGWLHKRTKALAIA